MGRLCGKKDPEKWGKHTKRERYRTSYDKKNNNVNSTFKGVKFSVRLTLNTFQLYVGSTYFTVAQSLLKE